MRSCSNSQPAGVSVTPDSALEALNLSTRARNLLRQLGCRSVRDVMEADFTRTVRSLGTGTRNEIAVALAQRGFAPPPALTSGSKDLEAFHRELHRFHLRILETHQRWLDQLARLEASIRKLSKQNPVQRGNSR